MMEPPASFADWLAGLGQSQLADLLRRRPDVIGPPPPRDLAELAQRLAHPGSLSFAVSLLPLPYLELLEVLIALGQTGTIDRAADLLVPTDDHGSTISNEAAEHRRQVEAVADQLVQSGLVWLTGGHLAAQPELRHAIESPLGLDAPLEDFLADVTVAQLHRLQTNLGLRAGGNKAAATAAVLDRLSRPEVVRELVDRAPEHVRTELLTMAEPQSDPYDDEFYTPTYQQTWLRRREAIAWAAEYGLVYTSPWDPSLSAGMPSQVALALRDDPTLPFHPAEPALIAMAVDAARVRAESAAAATEFDQRTVGLLDQLTRHPITALKSGGIGARELTRLAKAAGCDPVEVRLALELAWAADLIEESDRTVGVSAAFGDWRAALPGERLARLVSAWVQSASTPTKSRDVDGHTRAALSYEPPTPAPLLARRAMLAELANLGDRAATRESVASRVRWTRPVAADSDEPGAEPLALVWREAQLLGVLALDALSPLGRALVAGDPAGLRAAADDLLPAATGSATFGTDLTALVIGSPTPEVAGLLDVAADREKSGGGATIWRFSPASVRRAMDEGHSADVLRTRLAAISSGELPQPLSYLIGDVERRHGLLRIRESVSVIRCPDEALLAEVVADRRLRALGLHRLAPTVLGCSVPVDEALGALRAAGYFPMPDADAGATDEDDTGTGAEERMAPAAASAAEDAAGAVEPEFPDYLLTFADAYRDEMASGDEPPAESAEPVDPDELARRLAGGMPSVQAKGTTERILDGLTRRLSATQLHQLAFALDHGWPIELVYQSGTGRVSSRVLTKMRLAGDTIWAYSPDHQGLREFRVDRILDLTIIDPAVFDRP